MSPVYMYKKKKTLRHSNVVVYQLITPSSLPTVVNASAQKLTSAEECPADI